MLIFAFPAAVAFAIPSSLLHCRILDISRARRVLDKLHVSLSTSYTSTTSAPTTPMDDFITLDFLEDAAPVFDFAPPTPNEHTPEGYDEFMRMVANGDSPDGYFGGYCVVA